MTEKVPTTEVNVTCGFCGEVVTVEFRHGAVMTDWCHDSGVHVYVPRLRGDHACQSDRAKMDRRHHALPAVVCSCKVAS